jgi:predicted hydrocarbon binding protein
MALSEYRLFSKDGEIIVIGDESELAILEALSISEKSFSELLEELKIPKSTLSMKIDQLKEQEIIAEISVPADKRKKVYRLNGHLVSKRAKSIDIRDRKKKTTDKCANSQDPNTILRSMRCMLCETGVADQSILCSMGKKIGEEIAGKIKGNDTESITKGLDAFLQENNLGKIHVVSKKPLVVDVEEYEPCKDIEGSGRNFCAFDEGILQSVFSIKLNKKVLVKEMREETKRAKHTKYVILLD